jgi:hypothetical protein
MAGAAWATVLAYAVMAGLGFYFSQRYYPIVYEYARLGKIAAITAVLFGVAHFGDLAPVWRAVLLLAFPGILDRAGVFEKSEKERLLSWLKAKIKVHDGD